MRHTFIVARRVLAQLKGDRRFLALSLIGPLIIIYFLKLFEIIILLSICYTTPFFEVWLLMTLIFCPMRQYLLT